MRIVFLRKFLKDSVINWRYFSHSTDFELFLRDAHLQESVRKFQAIKELDEWKTLEKKASVLIPLCHVEDQVCILFTRRKMELRRHSGQVSFPGGMRDHDESVEEAATRETEEEIGIPRQNIHVYGHGSSVARFGVLITPVVGYIGRVEPSKLKISEKEVQFAFALPLSKFCDLNNCKYTRFKDSYARPVFLIDSHRVWGITAYFTHVFLTCLLGDIYKFKLR